MSTVLVGISGGIAAYKAAQLVSDLVKKGHDVEVLMTKNACEFITPLTLQTLSKHKVTVDSFDTNYAYDVHHISLAKKADCFIVVPATANVIAKIVHGIADDALTTTFLACQCPKIICPAMNTGMLENPVTQANLSACVNLGYAIVESGDGILACGDVGKGRLAELSDIEAAIEIALCKDKPFIGKKVLVNAGCTQEAIDPVRFISNHSTGKMGVAIANVFKRLGADVTLVLGPSHLVSPFGVKTIRVSSAQEMADACLKEFESCDIAVFSAAVADYTPIVKSCHKVKKSAGNLVIECERTVDILATCGKHKTHQITVGFAMETDNLIDYAKDKCVCKNADFIVANTINGSDCGFGVDTNRVTFVGKDWVSEPYFGTKEEVAMQIAYKVKSLCY